MGCTAQNYKESLLRSIPLIDFVCGPGNEEDLPKIVKGILKDRLCLIKNEAFAHMPTLMGEVMRDPEIRELWLKEFLQPFLGRIEMGFRMMGNTGKFRQLEPVVAVLEYQDLTSAPI